MIFYLAKLTIIRELRFSSYEHNAEKRKRKASLSMDYKDIIMVAGIWWT